MHLPLPSIPPSLRPCIQMLTTLKSVQVKTSRTFLRDCTVISPLALLLFGGPLSIAHAGGYVSVDRFRVRQVSAFLNLISLQISQTDASWHSALDLHNSMRGSDSLGAHACHLALHGAEHMDIRIECRCGSRLSQPSC